MRWAPAIAGLMLALAAPLAGCQMIPGYEPFKAAVLGATAGAIEERKQANDLQAGFTFASVCDLSVGSIGRTADPLDRDYALRKCAGVAAPAAPTVLIQQPDGSFLMATPQVTPMSPMTNRAPAELMP